MAKQIEELIQLAFKEQASFGTAESSFLASDVMEVEAGAKISIEPRVREISLVSGKFGQNQSVIGPREASISASMPFRTGGVAGSPGDVALFLQACGLKETDSSNTFTYIPTSKQSEFKDFTAWALSGNNDTSSAEQYVVQNIMGSGKITLDFDQNSAMFAFEGKGALNAAPSSASQVDKTASSIVVPSLVGATIGFFSDTDYIPISIEFDLGNEVSVTLNPSNTNGLGISLIAKRKIKWTAKVYRDSGIDPHGTLFAGTLGGISVAWGTGTNRHTVATTKAQITDVKDSDQNGISTYDLSGICVDNDLTITINTNAA